jgi:hypothetical protein
MVALEYLGREYLLTDDQGIHLAQNLRNYAKGTVPAGVRLGAELSGNPHWADGALCAAEFIEEILVGSMDGPLPLEGKAAEAVFWALRMLDGLLGSAEPTDMVALRDALGAQFQQTPA